MKSASVCSCSHTYVSFDESLFHPRLLPAFFPEIREKSHCLKMHWVVKKKLNLL